MIKVKKICINKDRDRHLWFTNGLRNACHKKNKLYKDFLKKRTFETELKYMNNKNKLTSIMRFSEKKILQRVINFTQR